MLTTRSPLLVSLVAVASLTSGGLAQAQSAASAPLATLNQHTITATDLNADLGRLPESARATAAQDLAAMQQLVANLVVRRAMAAEAHAKGLDKDEQVKALLRLAQDRVLSDAWLAAVDAKSKLPEAEVDRLADLKYKAEAFSRFKEPGAIKVRHILVAKEDKAKADELLAQLRQGADFAALAQQHSKDPGSAARGGDLGTVGKGRMVPAFEQAAFALQNPGELAGPVETGFGWHIIRLDERLPEKITPFLEVREQLRQEVIANARTQARNTAAAKLFEAVKLSDEAIQRFVEGGKSNR